MCAEFVRVKAPMNATFFPKRAGIQLISSALFFASACLEVVLRFSALYHGYVPNYTTVAASSRQTVAHHLCLRS